MIYSKYRIQCEFCDDGILNNFKGSALRGAFGHALKKAVCTVHKKDCEQCILVKTCLFTKLFLNTLTPTDNKKSPSIPFPYIIEPPLDSKTHYQKGETFEFSLIIFGELYEMLPFFVFAFDLMGKSGIGRHQHAHGSGASFMVKDVLALHNDTYKSIYAAEEKKLLTMPAPKKLNYDSSLVEHGKNQSVAILLHTPLRFKSDNRLSASLDFEQLYKLMARRATSMFFEYGHEQIHVDYHNLLAQAKSIHIVQNALKWEEIVRYSHKQQRNMKFGGLTGSVVYRGNIAPFVPLLELAELMHLGKQTSFGLGKISFMVKDTI